MRSILQNQSIVKNGIFTIFFMIATLGYSNSSFPTELPQEQTTTFQKKSKKERKKTRKVFEKLKNKYGTISVWTFVAGIVCLFSFILAWLGFILLIISAISAWYGTKEDEDPKRAERMLGIYLMLFGLVMLIIGWVFVVAFV